MGRSFLITLFGLALFGGEPVRQSYLFFDFLPLVGAMVV